MNIANLIIYLKKKFPLFYINFKVLRYRFNYSKLDKFREVLKFPFNNKQNLVGFFKPFLSKNKNGYYSRFYSTSFQTPSIINFLSVFKNSNFFFIEIYKSIFVKNKTSITIKNTNHILISHFASQKKTFEISNKNNKKKLSIFPERFSLIKLEKGKNKISTNGNFIYSNSFLKKKKAKNKKTVILIFIDGFVMNKKFNNNLNLTPNIKSQLDNGVIFTNNYSTAEWTLPSFTSIFTGKYPHNHGIYHPDLNYDISNKNSFIQSYFHNNNYFTFQINSGKRNNPAYGYAKDFDRSLFKENLDCKEVIFETIEHIETLNQFNNFIFLGLNDLHHFTKEIPPFFSQYNIDSNNIFKIANKNKVKSVRENFDKDKINILINQTKYLDKFFGIFFDYLNKKKDNNYLCSIVTDHGHSYLTKDNSVLSDARINVPWLVFGNKIKKNTSNQLTSNVDILPSLLSLSKISYNKNDFDGNVPQALGGKQNKKREIYSQSFFPNQTYKLILKNSKKSFFIETKKIIKDKDGIDLNNLMLKKNFEKNIYLKTSKILKSWKKNL